MGADHDFAVSIENYLKTMWHLEQRLEKPVSNRDLAESLQVARPSVSQMVSKLEALGFVVRESEVRGYRLSAKGRTKALKLLRAHRLVEMFLKKSLGLDGVFLHQEAERLEHAVSERLIAEMERYLGFPKIDSAGAPIPAALAEEDEPIFCDGRNPHLRLSKSKPGRYRIYRIHDDSAKLLEYLDSMGVGATSSIEVLVVTPQKVKFCVNDQKMSLSALDAASIEVSPV